MSAVSYSNFDFNQMRQRQRWTRLMQFNGDVAGFAHFVGNPATGASQGISPYAMAAMKGLYPEVEDKAGVPRPGAFMIYVDAGTDRTFISLAKRSDDVTLVWSCWSSEEVEPAACLRSSGGSRLGMLSSIG